MSRVTVLLARQSALTGLVDILRDWSALGVVGEVFVVGVDDLRGAGAQARRIWPGGWQQVSLSDELAGRHDIDLVRLGVLDLPARAEQLTADEAAPARSLLTRTLPHVPLVAVHLIAPQHGPDATGAAPRWSPDEALWQGWHNVVIAPENSSSPSAGIAPVIAAADNPVALTHPVAAAAGLLGALVGHTDSIFDDRAYLPGQQAFVARTFTRFLSAEALAHEVLARATDVSDRYPVPRYDGQQVLVVDDELDAATGQAERLFAKYPELLPAPRTLPPRRPQTAIGAWAALRMFFAFFFAALRNAPRAFVQALERRTQAAIAREVGDFVFGSGDSAYTVVVGGVGPDGRPVGVGEVDSALDALSDRAAGREVPFRPENLSGLWQDYVNGALTLLDAGARDAALPPIEVGAQRAVVSSTARVVPLPGAGFDLSRELASHLPGWRVEVGDVVRARQLDQRLAGLARDHGHLTEAVAHSRRELAAWLASADGYAGRVGTRIGDGLLATFAEIAHLSDQLRRFSGEVELPPDTAASQSRLGRTLLVIAGVALALVVATVLLTVYVPLDWWIGVICVLVIIIGWLWASVHAFLTHQRAIFAVLHQREEEARLSSVLRAHLQEALADARRLNRAYRQYLDFTRALGAFAHAPLGRLGTRRQSELLVGPGLPRNVQFGTADASDATLSDASEALRRNLFEAGWLTDGWRQFITDLPAGLGRWQYQLLEQPDVLWSDPRLDAAGSILTAWSRAVVEHNHERGVPSGFVARLDALLDDDSAGITGRLRERVRLRTSRAGDLQTVPHATFEAGLADVTGSQARYVFDEALFSASPEQLDPARVDDTTLQRAGSGLSSSLVLTQLSAGLRAVDLAGDQPRPAPATRPDAASLPDLPPV